MKTTILVVLALFTLQLAGTAAETNKTTTSITDTSYVETNGDRVIRLSVDVSASADEIWSAFTTAEGWKSFAVAFAQVDMKVGGIIETSYNPKAQAGDSNNIKNEIVAYIPGRMLAILEATQAAYGYLPVAALKHISQKTGAWYAMIYGTASYYAHLRFEPATATDQAAAVTAHRPPETSYLAALDAALGRSAGSTSH